MKDFDIDHKMIPLFSKKDRQNSSPPQIKLVDIERVKFLFQIPDFHKTISQHTEMCEEIYSKDIEALENSGEDLRYTEDRLFVSYTGVSWMDEYIHYLLKYHGLSKMVEQEFKTFLKPEIRKHESSTG